MSTETEDGKGERRTFTDVASLFQPIVPPAGTGVRPPSPAPVDLPPAAEPASPLPAPSAVRPELPAAASARQPAPVEERDRPWAEAWQPKPNWRPRRSWTWVLTLPLGLLAAAFMLTADPAWLRSWISMQTSHATNPIRGAPPIAPPAAAPPAAAPPAAAPAVPPAAAPPAADAPQAEPSASLLGPLVPPTAPPAPAEPTPSAEVAPETAMPDTSNPETPPPESVAPQGATPAGAQAGFGPVAIRYRRNQPSADAEAARIAAQLQPIAERVEIRAAAISYRAPTVLYFRPEDRAAAGSLAQLLGGSGLAWVVRLGQTRQKTGLLEVWLP